MPGTAGQSCTVPAYRGAVTTAGATGGRGAAEALWSLTRLPGVAGAVEEAREACSRLRWHRTLRRRLPECRAESLVRAARASAALDGARLPVDLVRDAARGASELPDDAAGRLVQGALRATAEAGRAASDDARGLGVAPWQWVARLHVTAAAGLVDADALGRPRHAGEPPVDVPQGGAAPDGEALAVRLRGLRELLSAPPQVPALLVAAVAHGELLAVRPFVAGNGVVARAVARAVVVGRGLDPTGVAVPEAAHQSDTVGYATATAAYASGSLEGVGEWIRHCAWAVVAGAGEGTAVADAVTAGRLPSR